MTAPKIYLNTLKHYILYTYVCSMVGSHASKTIINTQSYSNTLSVRHHRMVFKRPCLLHCALFLFAKSSPSPNPRQPAHATSPNIGPHVRSEDLPQVPATGQLVSHDLSPVPSHTHATPREYAPQPTRPLAVHSMPPPAPAWLARSLVSPCHASSVPSPASAVSPLGRSHCVVPEAW